MKNLVLLFVAFSLNFGAVAQAISGKVLHKDSDLPVSDALIVQIKNGKQKSSTKSSFDGAFMLKAKKGETISVEISKEGYQTLKTSVSLNNSIVRMQAKQGVPIFEEIKEGSVRKIPNPEIAENIGSLSNLPEGSKIIQVIPLEVQENKKTGFNVQQTNIPAHYVDVNAVKGNFNKQNIDALAFSTVEKFPSSFLADGNIFFGSGKALITWAVETHLQQLAKSVNSKKQQIKITAYADANQEAKVGDYIAKLRAEEVTRILLENGVDFKQLEVKITGNKALENNCYENVGCSEFEHQQNRRVDIEVIKL